MVSICRPAELDPRVAALDPAQLLEALQECSVTGLRFPVVRSQTHYDTNAPHALTLLPARRERPRSGAANQRDELAPFHSITSSASASSDGGTVRSIVLAVWALMTSSNLLACTTGRSAGFAPLRMRPA